MSNFIWTLTHCFDIFLELERQPFWWLQYQQLEHDSAIRVNFLKEVQVEPCFRHWHIHHRWLVSVIALALWQNFQNRRCPLFSVLIVGASAICNYFLTAPKIIRKYTVHPLYIPTLAFLSSYIMGCRNILSKTLKEYHQIKRWTSIGVWWWKCMDWTRSTCIHQTLY